MEGDAGSGRLTPAEDEGDETARPPSGEPTESGELGERTEAGEPAGDSPADRPPHSDNERQDPESPEIVAESRSEVDQPEQEEPTRSEVGVADADDAADEVPGQRSRLYSRGWVIGVAATLLVLALALAGVGVLARLADDDMQTRNVSEAAAVQAAKDCVIATQAPDLATMEASQRKIVECGTGDFGAQAVLYSGILVDAYQAAQAQVQVSNIRAAAERHNDDGTVDVLVALRVKVSNSTVQDQETGYRLRVQMAPEDGTYKIAKLDQVTR